MSDANSSFIGIVTVLYNSDEVLPDFFDSVGALEDIQYRVYVIDNGSTGSGTNLSKELARIHGIDAVFVFNNANLGVAKGNNQGIEMALADGCTHVLLSNNDTTFGPSAVVRMLDAMHASGGVASTPKIMYHSRPDVIWCAGGYICTLKVTTPHYGERQPDVGQFDEQRYVEYAPTCFMLFERRVFDVVGLMDESYFVYYDDTDFVWRMNAQGLRILYVPSAVVLHKVSTSTGGSFSPFTMYYGNRNRIYFLFKNLRGLQRVIALAYVMFTRPALILRIPWKSAREGWRGIRDGFRMVAKMSGSASAK